MSEEKNVKKKKSAKKKSALTRFLSVAIVGLSVFMLIGVGKEVMHTMELKRKIQEVETMLADLQKENEKLTSIRDKLEDPAYVQSYARGNYMLSREGEQVFYLPPTEK